MKYNVENGAERIVSRSPHVETSPMKNKGRWHEIFGNNNPIYLELGMGRGDMIVNMAKQNPDINFIGLEINESQMVNAVTLLRSMNLKNIKLINTDARNIADIFDKEIDTIYLTFCDPWPKEEDEKKRFTHESYLRLYDKIFAGDRKHIILKTDNKGFFAYSLESLSAYFYVFNKVSLDLHHEEMPIKNVMTNFEKQYAKENRTIYYVDARYPR